MAFFCPLGGLLQLTKLAKKPFKLDLLAQLNLQTTRTLKTSVPCCTSSNKPPSCRFNFHEDCEKMINKQINMELSASYAYLSMSYYFDREDVALPGFHEYFKKCSDEERDHAEMLMKYQNKRGGTIVLENIVSPSQQTWPTPLSAVVFALELEKSVYQNLLDTHACASSRNDPQLSDFLEGEFLDDQVKACKELSDMITNLKRVGPGLGEYQFDKELGKE